MTTTKTRARFDPAELIAAARAQSGLSNFGGDDYREPLEVVCRSLEEEAPLSEVGAEAARQRLIGTLAGRLQMQSWFDRHPEIAAEDVGAPVVIVGLPRTGTTMLYRMLAAAPGFVAPLHYEAADLSPPADWDFRPESDPRIPAAEASVAAMMAAMPELASIYPYEAMAPEESIYLYGGSLRSTSQQSSALVPGYDAWFRTADKRPAYEYLKKAVQFLQWQRRRSGRRVEGQRWLLKTPDHIHGLDALLDVFPGAQIIQTHRDPVQTIPSICSFIRVLHTPTTARDDSVDVGLAWSAMFATSMKEALAIRDRRPNSFLDVWYRDTVAEPRKVAETVFAFIGEPLTDAVWAEMEKWREANKREARPTHHYTLEEFGLSDDAIKSIFAEYRDRFIVPTL
jgi:hypothetical protein